MTTTVLNTSFLHNRLSYWLLGIVILGIFVGFLESRLTPFLYFGRVPLVSLGLFATIFPYLAMNNLKSLFIGAYDLTGFRAGTVSDRHGFRAGLVLGLVLVLCGMTIYTTATICMELGPVRTGTQSFQYMAAVKWVIGLFVWIGIVLNGCLIGSASTSAGFSNAARIALGGLVTGIVVGGLLWLGIEWFVKSFQGNLVEVARRYVWLSPVQEMANWLKSTLSHEQLRGYITLDSVPEGVELKHVGAVVFLLLSIAFYLLLQRTSSVPISYLLLLLVVLTWALTGLSFFLDFYRVPLLIPVGLWLLFAANHPKTDHFYPISLPNPDQDLSSTWRPADVLRRAVSRSEPIIAVAAAGGGIQSAAWTAQVLTGVEEHFLNIQTNSRPAWKFCEAVRLLSGVSGGSVGNMFFAAAYQKGSIPQNMLGRIRNAAFSSSLSEAVKAFAYVDQQRALAPFLIRHVYRDRGQALERAWMINAGCHPWRNENVENALCPTLDRATLKAWQEDVKNGDRPAVIFNATAVESGQRLAFSTAPFKPEPPMDPSAPSSVIDFSTEYSGADVLISTAVRLSSTFTYVSPAACPSVAHSLGGNGKPANANLPGDSQPLHVVDGGYYENSGVGALVAWLDHGLNELVEDKTQLPKRILIVTLGAFPPEEKNKNPRYADKRGAVFQFEAPFLALESLQGQAHPAGAFRELELLKENWDSKGVELKVVNFRFQGAQPPLSWHLRDCDKENIKKGWETLPEREKNLSMIDEFLRQRSS